MLGLSHYSTGKVDMTAQEFANLFTKHLDPNIPLVLVRRGTRSATTNATLANGKDYVGVLWCLRRYSIVFITLSNFW